MFLIVVSSICFSIAIALTVQFVRKKDKAKEVLYLITSMICVGIEFFFLMLWYGLPNPTWNQVVNKIATILMTCTVFFLTTFFFSIYFAEKKKVFHCVLAVTLTYVIVICALLAFDILQQAPIGADVRYEYQEDTMIILFLYFFPTLIVNYVLFMWISLKKYVGRLRTKSLLMGTGLLVWLFAEIVGADMIGWLAYVIYAVALLTILVGFLLKKEVE